MKYFQDSLFERIQTATKVTKTAVTCGFVDEVFTKEAFDSLIHSFPGQKEFTLYDKTNSGGGRKRFYVGPEYVLSRNGTSAYHLRHLSPPWKQLFKECLSSEFIQALSRATNTDCNTLLNFGIAYSDAGCLQEPHLDGAVRAGGSLVGEGSVAVLFYFNEDPDPISATEVYDVDRKTILLKGTTMRNSMTFFVQHANAWHGFPRVPEGRTRKIVSVFYAQTTDPKAVTWSLPSHLISKIKKKLK
jgi:hypothetical protein